MKINPYSSIQSTSATRQSKVNGQDDSMPSKSQKNDQIQISSEALDLQVSKQEEAKRAERVEALKKQIESGEYKVDAKKVAERFHDYWKQ
ncbi:flagellar biosynthesis anti-sigma factor FlgM [Alkalihalobacillus sp. FSL W8-0930]